MQKVAQLETNNQEFALATIIETKGSTPRSVGKMIVYPNGKIEGTVGGGSAEYNIIRASVEAIQQGKSRIVEYVLNPDIDGRINMHCGGTVKVFIEVYAKKPEIVIVGAGHVGQALAKLVEYLGYPYSVIDDRAELCTNAYFPQARKLTTAPDIATAIRKAQLSSNNYVTIFTKDADDLALRATLEFDCAYVGMIGSKTKANRVFQKLINEDGVVAELIKKVNTPIGLEIGAETPEEIAVSIMAEIIAHVKKANTQR